MPNEYSRYVGDRIERSRRKTADADPRVSRAWAVLTDQRSG
jgi:hypothetical protein